MGYRAMLEAFPEHRREAFLSLKQAVDPAGVLDTALFQRIFGARGGYTASV